VILFRSGMLYSVYLWFWKTFSYFSVFRSMFLFLRKYGVEMSRAESPVLSYTCADLAAPNWRRRIGGAGLSHSVMSDSLQRLSVNFLHFSYLHN